MKNDPTTPVCVASSRRGSGQQRRRWLVLACALMLALVAATGCSKVPADDLVAEARELAAQGDTTSLNEAITTLEPLINRPQTPVGVVNLYLALHLRTSRADEVLSIAEANAEAEPSDYMALYLLGKIYAAHSRDEDALTAFKAARALNEDSLNVLIATAQYAGRENDPEAGEYFRLLEERDPSAVNRAQLYNEWGLWLAQQENRHFEAIQVFGKGWAEKKSAVLALNTAIVYERFQPAVARRWYKEYKARLPADDYADRHILVQRKLRTLPQ